MGSSSHYCRSFSEGRGPDLPHIKIPEEIVVADFCRWCRESILSSDCYSQPFRLIMTSPELRQWWTLTPRRSCVALLSLMWTRLFRRWVRTTRSPSRKLCKGTGSLPRSGKMWGRCVNFGDIKSVPLNGHGPIYHFSLLLVQSPFERQCLIILLEMTFMDATSCLHTFVMKWWRACWNIILFTNYLVATGHQNDNNIYISFFMPQLTKYAGIANDN